MEIAQLDDQVRANVATKRILPQWHSKEAIAFVRDLKGHSAEVSILPNLMLPNGNVEEGLQQRFNNVGTVG